MRQKLSLFTFMASCVRGIVGLLSAVVDNENGVRKVCCAKADLNFLCCLLFLLLVFIPLTSRLPVKKRLESEPPCSQHPKYACDACRILWYLPSQANCSGAHASTPITCFWMPVKTFFFASYALYFYRDHVASVRSKSRRRWKAFAVSGLSFKG